MAFQTPQRRSNLMVATKLEKLAKDIRGKKIHVTACSLESLPEPVTHLLTLRRHHAIQEFKPAIKQELTLEFEHVPRGKKSRRKA